MHKTSVVSVQAIAGTIDYLVTTSMTIGVSTRHQNTVVRGFQIIDRQSDIDLNKMWAYCVRRLGDVRHCQAHMRETKGAPKNQTLCVLELFTPDAVIRSAQLN